MKYRETYGYSNQIINLYMNGRGDVGHQPYKPLSFMDLKGGNAHTKKAKPYYLSCKKISKPSVPSRNQFWSQVGLSSNP